MKFIFYILILILIVILSSHRDHFTVPPILAFKYDRIVNPLGWKWVNSNTISTNVSFETYQGEYNYKNLISVPGIGFPIKENKYGYSNWNYLTGINEWFAWNKSTGGTGWFWWKTTSAWNHLPDKQKRRSLHLHLFITSQGNLPPFPADYYITFPDWNYDRYLKTHIQFTSNPMDSLPSPSPRTLLYLREKAKGNPLQLYNNKFIIPSNKWISNDYQSYCTLIIKAKQGEIDGSLTYGKYHNSSSWLSWNVHQVDEDIIHVVFSVNRKMKLPKFPYQIMIYVKDKNYEKYMLVRVILNEINNANICKKYKCKNKKKYCLPFFFRSLCIE